MYNLLIAISFFQKINENADIIKEAMDGDKTASKMLIQEFKTQKKIYCYE